MAKKAKASTERSTTTVDLGKARKSQIKVFRAMHEQRTGDFLTLEQTVCHLVDKALELEKITA